MAIVVADPYQRFRSYVAEHLPMSDPPIPVEGMPMLEELLRNGSLRDVEVLLFGPDFPPEEALKAAEKIRLTMPEVSVVMVSWEPTTDLLRAALRTGIKDVLPASVAAEELMGAVGRAQDLSRQLRGWAAAPAVERSRGVGRLVTIFSSKGGSGKTFLAANLAVLLAESQSPVALVDLDLQSGDLAIMFQLMPPWTIYDAAEHIEGLDGEALRGYLSPHRSGVYLLPAPVEPSLAEAVSSQAVIKILRLLKDSFPYVVVDCPSAYNDQVLAALDESDAVVLIASMEVPGIKSLKLALQTLEQLGVSRERIRIVLNRADSKVGLRLQEVEKTLGSSVDIALPSTIRVPQSVNRGVPIAIEARNSSVVVPIAKLARSLIASTQGTRVEPSRWGFLRRG